MRPNRKSSLVWYLAYGSNLSRDRLRCYLAGGCAPGARVRQRGARDARPPLASRAMRLPLGLRFAGVSAVWGGGKAFVRPTDGARRGFVARPVGARPTRTGRPASVDGRAMRPASPEPHTLARAWLLRREQFDDLAAQESSRAHVTLALDELRRHGSVQLGDGAYDLLLYCGVLDDVPMVTFTTPNRPEVNAPSVAYLRTLARGLRDSHHLAPATVARYLAGADGVRASAEELAQTLFGEEGAP